MQFFVYVFIINIVLSYASTSTNFNVTIKTPGNETSIPQSTYKSIHVKYTVPNSTDRWNIVAIEPFVQKLKEVIQQISVHICESPNDTNQPNTIWYDDDTYCQGARSMLIYQWIFYSAIPKLNISSDFGFQLDKSRFIVLTIKFFKEQQSHDHQIGIILSISTVIPTFNLGTIFIGNKQRGIRFSCRSVNYPRLLYGVKSLFPQTTKSFWRIYVIRSRSFGRKLVQFGINSTMYSEDNPMDLKQVSSDTFLIPGDYLMVECTEISDFKCQFLIYYTYKNLPYKFFDENDHTCQADNHPKLFKLLPSTTTVEDNLTSSNIEGSTIFSLVFLLLFVIWVSIIIGCVVMRRIRGLVNFRSEPSTPQNNQYAKTVTQPVRTNEQVQQKLIAEADRTAQLDIEHMGLMS